MATVSLKVTLVDQNTTKTLQFPGSMTISEVCRDIRERIGDSTSGPSDHGLYSLAMCKWLAKNKTLDFYDMKSGDAVEYKKKHRPLRVKLMDGAMKTVLVDDSAHVSEIVETVCERIGIANPEEYSLLRDYTAAPAEASGSARRKTLPRSNEALNSDEGHWLNPEKMMSEQGVLETDVLLLKKKFFFSDQNVDRNDPIQLNLLYVQARDAIVSGKHPCKLDEASQLAALQCQVQYGNHEPDKHKPGFIKLKDFVPPEYQKGKQDFEKKIFQEHRKLQGLNELNAKFRYVQLCRSLKTYGVTFFLVKEKVPKKNKLEPRLLGVTRDSVMRLDAETKEIIKVWPLTTLRRWAASPNSFTLDFGDYADAYHSVQTTEGEQISQLIAGYIDIILKKRKEAANVKDDDDEQVALGEETVRPAKASAITTQSNRVNRAMEVDVVSAGVVADDEGRVGARNVIKKKQIAMGAEHGMAEYAAQGAQVALMQNISNGFASVNSALSDLSIATILPPMGNDPASIQWRNQTMEVQKQTVASQVGSHLAATCAIINMTTVGDLDRMDFNAIGANFSTLSSSLLPISSGTKMAAALMERGHGDQLLEAAKALAACTNSFLSSVQPIIMGEAMENPQFRQDMLSAGQEMARTGHILLSRLGETEVTPGIQHELMELAKAVVQATVNYVGQGAKQIAVEAAAFNLGHIQHGVIQLAKQTASSAESLVTTTMIASPAINMAVCQDRILQGTMQIRDSMGELSQVAIPLQEMVGRNAKSFADLANLASKVNDAMAKLIERSKNWRVSANENGLDNAVNSLVDNASAMMNNLKDTAAIVNGARGLTVGCTQVVNLLKQSAEGHKDASLKEKQMEQAKALAEATSKMVALAKDAARHPDDKRKISKLKEAVEAIQNAAIASAAADKLLDKFFHKLGDVAKRTVGSTTQLISASRAVAPSNRNQTSQMQLNQTAKKAADAIANLVSATKAYLTSPSDTNTQMKLITTAKSSVVPASGLVSAAKVAAATTGDQGAQQQLIVAARENMDDLNALFVLAVQVENVRSRLELPNALASVASVLADLAEAQKDLASGKSAKSSNRSAEEFSSEVASSSNAFKAAIGQLVTAISQGNEKTISSAARDTVAALQTWFTSVKGLAAASHQDPALQKKLLDAANLLASKIQGLLRGALSGADPSDISSQASAATDVVSAVVNNLPTMRDIEKATKVISAGLDLIKNGPTIQVASNENFSSAQSRLNAAAAALVAACNSMTSATRSGNSSEIKNSASQLEDHFNKMIEAAQVVLCKTSDPQIRDKVLQNVKLIGDSSLRLLNISKTANGDQGNSKSRQLLNGAANVLASSVGKLLDACSISAPGLSEISRADQTLLSAIGQLDCVNDPIMASRSTTYFDCSRAVQESGKELERALSGMNSAAKSGDVQTLGQLASDSASAVSAIVDASARAAYLIGVSDPSSSPAVAGAVDAASVIASSEEVIGAIRKLRDASSGQSQILQAASTIARHTAVLCNLCKQSSQNPQASPSAKQQFIQSAKSIATATSALVGSLKSLSVSGSEGARELCAQNAKPLSEAVENLVTFSSSPDLAPILAVISPVALQKLSPVVNSARSLVLTSQDMNSVIRSICQQTGDSTKLQLLAAQSRTLVDALNTLTNLIRQNAPGQKECDDTIEVIGSSISEVDAAIMDVDMNALGNDKVTRSSPMDQGMKDALLDNFQALLSLLPVITGAAKGDSLSGKSGDEQASVAAGQLGVVAQQLSMNYQPTTTAAINVAASSGDINTQRALLNSLKDIGNVALTFMFATKNSGGDSNAEEAHQHLDGEKVKLEKSINKFIEKLVGNAKETQEITEMSDVMQNSLRSIPLDADSITVQEGIPGDNYQVYAQNVMNGGKDVVTVLTEIVGNAMKPSTDILNPQAVKVTKAIDSFISEALKALNFAADSQIRQNLLDAARNLGGGSLKLLDAMKAAIIALNNSPNAPVDITTRQKIASYAKELSQTVAKMIAISREGSKGLQVCEQAIQLLEDLVGDLDSQIIFAQAGHLDPHDKKESFDRYKEALQSIAKDLVEGAKQFVAAAASANQDSMAKSISTIMKHVSALQENTKKATIAITSSDKCMQEQLLESAKVLSTSLSALIQAAVDSVGKPITISASGTVTADNIDIGVEDLKNAAKAMVVSAQEFVKTVRVVGDESSRGARAIQGAVREINAAIASLSDDSPPEGLALPEEVAGIAKGLATAAAHLVSVSSRNNSSGNQEELISATSDFKSSALGLLRAGKAATDKAPGDQKGDMIRAVTEVSRSANVLLQAVVVFQDNSSAENKTSLQGAAKKIAESVNRVVEAAGALIPAGYVDPNDPNVVAERELLAAASSIEAAARKLATLKAPERPREANEELNFEQQIFEAAQSIAAATGALVRSATSAQREIVAKRRSESNTRGGKSDEGGWSNGLVEIAKQVAYATGDLCEAANAAVKGEVQRERVVAASRAVSASTRQLLADAAVKVDKNSQSHSKLQAAGKSVVQAAEMLVKAAEESMAFDEADHVFKIMKEGGGGIAAQRAQELEAQARVIQMEKELEMARMRLVGVRKAKYSDKATK